MPSQSVQSVVVTVTGDGKQINLLRLDDESLVIAIDREIPTANPVSIPFSLGIQFATQALRSISTGPEQARAEIFGAATHWNHVTEGELGSTLANTGLWLPNIGALSTPQQRSTWERLAESFGRNGLKLPVSVDGIQVNQEKNGLVLEWEVNQDIAFLTDSSLIKLSAVILSIPALEQIEDKRFSLQYSPFLGQYLLGRGAIASVAPKRLSFEVADFSERAREYLKTTWLGEPSSDPDEAAFKKRVLATTVRLLTPDE
jgi:hypothetical protein